MKNSGLKILSLLSFVFLISCVNEEYDLDKELKTEATLFENIAVPVGNIKKITIDDLLFTDDAEMVGVTEDGDYFLDFISGSYESSVDIPSFSIEGMRLEDQTIYFNIPPSFVGTSLDALDLTIRYSDLVPGGLDFDMDIIVDSPMPEELIDVDEIHMDGTMTCNFSTNVGKVFVSKGFEISFPDYVFISKRSSSASYEIVDSHRLRFLADTEVSTASPLSIGVSFDRLNVPEGAISENSGVRKVIINDKANVKGDFYVRTKDFTDIPEEIRIIMHIGVENLAVTKAMVSLDIESHLPSQEIILGDMPDIMEGNDIIIDLYNPSIDLLLNNGSPFGFYLTGDLTAYNSSGSHNIHIGVEGPGSATGDEIFVDANGSMEYYFSRRTMTDIPSGAGNIVIPDIAELIKDLPEKITIHDLTVYPVADAVMIDAGASYDITVDYGVSAPMSFGEDLNLAFTQTIENLGLTFDEVKVRSAELRMEIINTIPVDFSIEAECIDSDGEEMSGTTLSMDNHISAGSQDSPVTTPVKISLSNRSGILDIDELKLTMKALSASSEYHGICLNKNQGFEIRNIVLSLPDGVGVEF